MGWVKKIDLPHQCPLPRNPRVAVGSRWQCDECGKTWTYDAGTNGQWLYKGLTEVERRDGQALDVDPAEYDYGQDPLPFWKRW